MKQLSVLLFMVFLTWQSMFAQDRSFGTLPMVQKPDVGIRSTARVEETEDSVALSIYNKLVAARGDYRFPVPKLSIKNQERSVAWMDYDKLEITLEAKALEVCKPYGDAAIAFLLGHELTHYYEKHAWRRGFVADNRDLKIGMVLNDIADDAANETEADYLGGFLAYSAGYGLFDKGDEVIKKLYDAYQLPPDIDGYPSLMDRQALAKRTTEKLEELVEAFEMASLLTAIDRYSEAYAYYRHVLMAYQSREIYNNLGVTAVLDAMQYMKESEKKFKLPLELDLESSGTRGSGMATDVAAKLRQAILHFDAAISLDPNYAPAYLNKACAYTLLGDTTKARFYADIEARAAATFSKLPKTQQDVDILLAILEAQAGNAAQAKKMFMKAAYEGSALAAANLRILEPVQEAEISRSAGGISAAERIDGLTMAKIKSNIQIDDQKTRDLGSGMRFHQNPAIGTQSKLFVNENAGAEEYVLIQMTNPGYAGKTALNIQIGSKRAAIIEAYGEPRRTIETPRGEILVYPKMLFILGGDGKVARWANYDVLPM
ncbi:MAG: tetratricopeptide repeat protein [Saprospiraceae bacterium]|nr:tetratricopeptide repeat protein [Saprospiraceae bacterium]